MKPIIAGIVCLLSVACAHNPIRAQTAAFPGALATDANLKVQVNGVQTTLSQNLTAGATTGTVLSCTGIVANTLATIDQEITSVTSCAASVITFNARGYDGTTAAAHGAGAPVSLFADAWHHNALRVEVEAIETALGANLANVITTTLPYVITTGGSTIPLTLNQTAGGTALSVLSGTILTGSITLTGSSNNLNGNLNGTHAQNVGVADKPTLGGLTISGTTNTPTPLVSITQSGTGRALFVNGNSETTTQSAVNIFLEQALGLSHDWYLSLQGSNNLGFWDSSNTLRVQLDATQFGATGVRLIAPTTLIQPTKGTDNGLVVAPLPFGQTADIFDVVASFGGSKYLSVNSAGAVAIITSLALTNGNLTVGGGTITLANGGSVSASAGYISFGGAVGLTCSGSPTNAFASVLGIVTHC